MNKIFTAVLAVFISWSAVSFGQSKEVTVHAEGQCELSRHITMEQAEQKALQEAKIDALNRAGVEESVWSAFGMITESDSQHFNEAYSEMSILAVGGLVQLIDAPQYTRTYSDIDKREYVICKIHAKVKKGETSDKSFQMQVKGILPVYKEGQLLDMQITTSQDAYVRIFWFNKTEGEQILPNVVQQDHFTRKGATIVFPDISKYEFSMEKSDKNVNSELVTIMVVATKKDYPFFESEVSFQSLLNWIYNIPTYDRCTYYETFYIK